LATVSLKLAVIFLIAIWLSPGGSLGLRPKSNIYFCFVTRLDIFGWLVDDYWGGMMWLTVLIER
jgi:hypothetical protein